MEESTQPAPSTRAIGVKWGLISTAIGLVIFCAMYFAGMNAFGNGWALGLFRFAIAIVILVLAHNEFKSQGDGFMTYGQGFMIGLWITLIGVLISGIFMYVFSNFIDTGVMDLMYEDQAEQMRQQGQNEDAIEMAQTWTKKLFWPLFFVFGFIFGLVVPLIVTIFTQKKNQQADFQ